MPHPLKASFNCFGFFQCLVDVLKPEAWVLGWSKSGMLGWCKARVLGWSKAGMLGDARQGCWGGARQGCWSGARQNIPATTLPALRIEGAWLRK